MLKEDSLNIKKLYEAVLTLKSADECAAFFTDLCTVQELKALAQRLEVACDLYDGKSYLDINKSTGASTTTICRVSKALNYGDGGYKTVIERLDENGN